MSTSIIAYYPAIPPPCSFAERVYADGERRGQNIFAEGLLFDPRRRVSATTPGIVHLPKVLPSSRSREELIRVTRLAKDYLDTKIRETTHRPLASSIRPLTNDFLIPLIYMREAYNPDVSKAMLPFPYELIDACHKAHAANRRSERWLLCSTEHLMPISHRSNSRASCTGWRGWGLSIFVSSLVVVLPFLITDPQQVLIITLILQIAIVAMGMCFTGMMGHFVGKSDSYELSEIQRLEKRHLLAAKELLRLRFSEEEADRAALTYLKEIDITRLKTDFTHLSTQKEKADDLYSPLEEALHYITFLDSRDVESAQPFVFRHEEIETISKELQRGVGDTLDTLNPLAEV